MRDQSCGQRHSLVLALMINTLPPATSLTVAPEASLGAAELQHCLICSALHTRCVRQGGEGPQAAAAAAFLTLPLASTSARTRKCGFYVTTNHRAWGMGEETFGFWCSFTKNITQIHTPGSNANYCLLLKSTQQKYSAAMYIQIQKQMHDGSCVKMHIFKERDVCESERETCRFCRLSPVNCNSNTSSPRGYFFPFPLINKGPILTWSDYTVKTREENDHTFISYLFQRCPCDRKINKFHSQSLTV